MCFLRIFFWVYEAIQNIFWPLLLLVTTCVIDKKRAKICWLAICPVFGLRHAFCPASSLCPTAFHPYTFYGVFCPVALCPETVKMTVHNALIQDHHTVDPACMTHFRHGHLALKWPRFNILSCKPHLKYFIIEVLACKWVSEC